MIADDSPNPQKFKLKKSTKALIISATFYKKINQYLTLGAEKILKYNDVSYEIITVPGALEIPTAIGILSNQFSGFIALGCVIRGETTHYDSVCHNSANSIATLGLQGVCIGNGILNVENYDQAVKRADPKGKDFGGNAATAALALVEIKQTRLINEINSK